MAIEVDEFEFVEAAMSDHKVRVRVRLRLR
jgi:hypothetical protein